MVESPYRVSVKKYRKKYRSVVVPESVEVVDKSTGEVDVATKMISNMKLYDTTDFIKFYDWGVLKNLSKCGVGVLSYVMNELRFDGVIHFNLKKCMKWTGYGSDQSIYNGLNELLGLDVLRRSKTDKMLFYVNPNVIFRGDRSKIKSIFEEN